ncbi:hypothetical protein [Streptomyces sp. NK08204]|uniref:hypothetical protein n=1 Tax=Streptomyces sp. NK08204 TaxID=2873260 RepID=UPI001CED0EA0|nr:hypothetical protein [Streptomyces sp. NK08204]
MSEPSRNLLHRLAHPTTQERKFDSVLMSPTVQYLFELLKWLTPSQWIIHKSRGKSWPIEVYVIAVTAALVAALLLANDHDRRGAAEWAQAGAVVIAWWRWAEILAVGLELAIGRVRMQASSAIVAWGIFLFQATLIFAIIAEVQARNGFKFPDGHPGGALDYFYVSWTNLATLGNSVAPITGRAELIVVLTGLTGLVLIGIILTYAMKGGDASQSE